MLVLGLLLPPLTRMRPSNRLAVPGQNMSSPVFVTRTWVDVLFAGSKTPVYVWPVPDPMSPSYENWELADHISTLPFGRLAAAMGLTDTPITEPQLDGMVAVDRLHCWFSPLPQVHWMICAPLVWLTPLTSRHKPLFLATKW